MGNFLQMLGVLLGFGAILFLVYITTRYIGAKANKASRGRYVSIVETVSLGLDKQLHLIKAGGQYVLISSSGKNIQFLTTLNLDDSEFEDVPSNNPVFDFKGFFDKYLQNFRAKKADNEVYEDSFGSPNEKDVFKSNLNRLRAITTEGDKQSKVNGDGRTNDEKT
jgi:flagellar protein FliO/FliZ